MKPVTALFLFGLLLAAPRSMAQTVLQGDSIYHSLKPGRDSLASVIAQLGRHYRKKELLSWYTAKLRSGGCISGTNVIGYALHYKKLGVVFCVDNEKRRLNEIHFDATASIMSVQGIRPGVASFAEVIKKYGLPPGSGQNGSPPKIDGFWDVNKHGVRRHYLTLSYPSIRFISWGNRVDSESMLRQKVQEIWLR